MPGLSLMGGAQVGVAPSSLPSSPAASVTEAAFGPGAAPASGPGTLAPTHPAGVAFWWSIFSVGALLFLYFTLPE